MTEENSGKDKSSTRNSVGKSAPGGMMQFGKSSSETEYQKDFAPYQPPSVSLPKGGGAIRGMGEKFSANPVTGTGSLSVPLPLTPGRSGFGPQLSLSYDSGSGNGIFGLGWHLSLPSITRKTSKGIPRYNDRDESDVFILSDAEDLVPQLELNGDQWEKVSFSRNLNDSTYSVFRYRPRTEGLFARIEKWQLDDTGDTHWRVITKDNITSIYGLDNNSRIHDPANPAKVYSWLLCRTFDDKGNIITYEYEQDSIDYSPELPPIHEINRTPQSRSANRYIKTIRYGNSTPWIPEYSVVDDETVATEPSLPLLWHFETIFEYAPHNEEDPLPGNVTDWEMRQDPFSQYNAGFEIRTYRLCHRVLMFHSFPDETSIGERYLVRSLDLKYGTITDDGSGIATGVPCFSRIVSVIQSGYQKNGAGEYESESLPPLQFQYTLPQIDNTVREIAPEEMQGIRIASGGSAQWTDLFGEGLTGILCKYENGWYYKRNRSQLTADETGHCVASFGPAIPVSELPSMAGHPKLQFMDLAGDGHPDMVVLGGAVSGFHEIEQDIDSSSNAHILSLSKDVSYKLSNFRTFSSLPNINWDDPDLRFVDLTGDGLADILITQGDLFTWYQSLGEEGFERAQEVWNAIGEEKGPRVLFSDAEQKIFLADMSGDGLTDIVRIRNGEVCYWPNLGYGRFGEKVTMGDAPVFDNPDIFNPKRIVLADIDGSGLTDILYYTGNTVTIWFNLSGNSWAAPYQLTVPVRLDDTMMVSAFDLLGNGTACLVWSSGLPSPDMIAIRYVELMRDGKPHLLSKITNNFGADTSMRYAPSTQFYLQDLQNGTPWITRLSFPVHVLERVEHYDAISKSRLVTRYAYHHGYFDGDEREFRGFAKVEQWDTESFDADSGMGHGSDGTDDELVLPPVRTVSYFHTGAFLEASTYESRLSAEYFDIGAGFVLPDTQIPSGLSPQEAREAHRALRGSLLRSELYAEDGTEKADKPYVVTEQSFIVRQEQPQEDNRHAVFFVYPDQTVTLNYERNETDPRIAHALTLAVDEFGTVRESASVAYPRQTTPHDAEQEKLWVSYSVTNVINSDTYPFWRRIGVADQATLWELTGPIEPEGTIYTLNEFRNKLSECTEIPYEQVPDSILSQKKRVKEIRNQYLKNDLSGPLTFGDIESLALPYKSYVLALTDTLITSLYESRVTATMVTGEARYVQMYSAYWLQSNSIEYDATSFYQPVKTIDPFGGEFTSTWDQYLLLVEGIEDAIGNQTDVRSDYRLMVPSLVTDPNGNRTEAAFDPLGRVIKIAVMGKTGDSDGDTIDDPTMQFEYFNAELIGDEWKPAYVHTLAREQHGASNPRWQESYLYTDGLGREAMSKVQAEPGDAPERDSDGNLVYDEDENLVLSHTDTRWVGTGRTVYDNKGNPVKKYEPFFSSTYQYEDEDDLVQWGVTPILHYDPLGRLIRTEFPDGTESRVVFDAWYQETWDQNDCVTGSRWLTERLETGAPADERTAALQTQVHADTPAVSYLDSLGRVYLSVENNGTYGNYETCAVLDIEGNVLSVTDQRGITAFTYKYDIAGTQVYTNNPDAGERYIFTDTTGNPLRTWDSREHIQRFIFDVLRRATHTYVQQGANPEHLMIRTVYGESLADPVSNNHRGKVYQVFDGAGVLTSNSYDFKGNLLGSTRHIASEYHQTPNWDVIDGLTDANVIWTAAQSSLETQSYSTSTEFDALNRVVSSTTPDGSVTRPVYNEANLLNSVEIYLRGAGIATEYVRNIDYNAKGQRMLVSFGNGTATTYGYDPNTFRLTQLQSIRSSDNQILQDNTYTYDPVGNIISIRDNTDWDHLFGREPVSGDGEYFYDPLYRLIQASGREHPGQQPTNTDSYLHAIPHPNDTGALIRYIENYSYDQTGNMLSMQHSASGGNWTRGYQYSTTGNRLLATSAPGDPSGTYSHTYSYNNHGSMTSMPHLSVIDWDYAERIQHTDLGGGGDVYFTYDASGQRIRKAYEHNGIVEDRLYFGAWEIYSKIRSDTIELERETLHVMDDIKRIALIETKTVDTDNPGTVPQTRARYQLDNHLGSTALELDNYSNVISYEEYHPFGTSSFISADSGAEVSTKRYRYTGKERDDETGLYYYGARYYASWLGRWLGCDPLVEDGCNLYIFVSNNPIRLKDPNGASEINFESISQNPDAYNVRRVSYRGKIGYLENVNLSPEELQKLRMQIKEKLPPSMKKMPVNYQYAGKTVNLYTQEGTTKIPFTTVEESGGMIRPKFESTTPKTTLEFYEVEGGLKGEHNSDLSKMRGEYKKITGEKFPKDYTPHHVNKGSQPVKSDVHGMVRHSGDVATAKATQLRTTAFSGIFALLFARDIGKKLIDNQRFANSTGQLFEFSDENGKFNVFKFEYNWGESIVPGGLIYMWSYGFHKKYVSGEKKGEIEKISRKQYNEFQKIADKNHSLL